MKKRKGISLIVLVLTIIVIVILATAVILSIANNNPIENAKKAKFLNDVKTFEEDYALRTLNSYFDLDDEVEVTISDLTDNEEYRKKLIIKDDKIVLKESAATEQEIEWAQEAGIKVLKDTYLKKRFESIYDIDTDANPTFYEIENINNIEKIIFEDTIENVTDSVVDISEEGNGSVIGWVEGTEVHIASDGVIFAPENSLALFGALTNLTEIQNMKLLDTSNVTDMCAMFLECSNLLSLNLSSFDTSNVTDMSGMFSDCGSLTSLDLSGFDTSNVTNMYGMFGGCGGLTSLDLSSFDTSNVTNMSSMFYGCNLQSLDLSSFDTSNVTNMSSMFDGCNLQSLDLSSFDTSNVTDMSGMFDGCNLQSLDLSSFDTSNVADMSNMFSCCRLTSLDLSGFDTSNVTNMYEMFSACGLTSLDLSSFDTSNVTNMTRMFNECSRLAKIEVSNKFNTNNVTTSFWMFFYCTSLVGENGTRYNFNHIDVSYARIDTAETPGYFTLKVN